MSTLIKLSESNAARRKLRVYVADSANAPVTGLAATLATDAMIRLGSSTSGTPTGSFTEVDSADEPGWYDYTFHADEAAAAGAGRLSYYDEAVGTLYYGLFQVVGFDPYEAFLLASGYTAPLDAAGVRTAVGLASANLDTQMGDIPTVSEFQARTIAAADYFDPATDIVAHVTLVDTVTTLTNTFGLSQADVRTAVGLASANLDTQLADVPTVAEFEARTILAAAYFDPAVDVVARVTLVDTTTALTNTFGLSQADIRTAVGLASANLDTQLADIPTVAEFNARTLAAADYFDPATDTVAHVTLVDTVTILSNHISDSAIRNAVGLAAANLDTQLGNVPTVAEFEARTLVSGSYFDPAADTVAHVTLVDTVTDLTNQSGSNPALIAEAVWDESRADALLNATAVLLGKLTGITSLAQWLRHMFRADASDATSLAEINSGGGGFSAASDSVQAIRDRGDAAWLTLNIGDGANAVTVTVLNDDDEPVENVSLRLTSAGVTAAGPVKTNSSGVAIFSVDDGTYLLAVTKSGYSHTPQSIVVDGEESVSVTMTGVIAVASSVSQCMAYLTTFDGQGNIQSDVDLTFVLAADDGEAGQSSTAEQFVATSDDNGLLQVELMRGATYRVQRGSGRPVTVVIPDAASYELPEVLGA